jgi:hypothetical protein
LDEEIFIQVRAFPARYSRFRWIGHRPSASCLPAGRSIADQSIINQRWQLNLSDTEKVASGLACGTKRRFSLLRARVRSLHRGSELKESH